eukprot:m.341506 g.341506  ORF g.341506 m.341506 type:complete len:836 (+) comp20155_c1_seq1:182-2689(+)
MSIRTAVINRAEGEKLGLKLTNIHGRIIVGEVTPGSPADKCAKIHVGDCIQSINNHPVPKNPTDINTWLRTTLRESTQTVLSFISNQKKKKKKKQALASSEPATSIYSLEIPIGKDGFGFTVNKLSNQLGTYVGSVDAAGEAFRQNLAVGDRIHSINGIDVESMDINDIISLCEDEDTALQLTIARIDNVREQNKMWPILEDEVSEQDNPGEHPVDGVGHVHSITIRTKKSINIGHVLQGGEIIRGQDEHDAISVKSIQPNSLADQAGLREGDIIVGVNGENSKGTSRQSIEHLILRSCQKGSVTLVVTRDDKPNKEGSDAKLHRVVLKRQPIGLGMAVTGPNTPGSGVFVEFIAEERPIVLTGSIHPGDEIVAIDGKSIVSMPITQAVEELKSVDSVFELIIRHRREGITTLPPPYIPPPSLSASELNGVESHWSGSEHQEIRHRSLHTRHSRPKNVAFGCHVTTLKPDRRGLGFSVYGGLDTGSHGVFVAHVAEDGPAFGRIQAGDLLLYANDQIIFDVTHIGAVEAINNVALNGPLELVFFRDERGTAWRAPQNVKTMFHSTSFITGSALGLEICGGADTDLGGVYIKQIKQNSAAFQVGKLSTGDQIIAVNGHIIYGLMHREAADVLRQSTGLLTILVQTSTFTAKSGHTPSHLLAFELTKDIEDFGLLITARRSAGGRTQVLVKEFNSTKETLSQLRVGDELVSINGVVLTHLSQSEALQQIKTCPVGVPATLVIRRFGTPSGKHMTVHLVRPSTETEFGFGAQMCIAEGPHDKIVTWVDPIGHAARTLVVGDAILAIDGNSTLNMTQMSLKTQISLKTNISMDILRHQT